MVHRWNHRHFPFTLVLMLCPHLYGQASADEQTFRPVTVIRRAFPAIKDVTFVSAAKANRQLRPEELVLGVVIDNQARAYPINMLKGPRREIINDRLAGVAIAATW